ncbi:MAG: SUMF1/EgtB/PvdO family nonheme iron enzyme, partial [Candidatus Cloacimonadaceae bacterium]|nr:SUMF1/EgtB/PvdO family nonheme iron enzyme [Candidatus Cloacimonadaceae bacterium]
SFWYFGTDPNVWPSNFSNFVMGAGDTRNLITCNWNANGYRLPTEMEWMFAAKGGNLSQCFIYSGSDDLSRVGWYDGNSGGEPHEVGMRTPNELGLFDMSGNVSELVWDNLGPYPHDDQTNPTGFPYSEYGIIRGGSFYRPDTYSTVAYRDQNGYTTNSFIVGIRVVRRISP